MRSLPVGEINRKYKLAVKIVQFSYQFSQSLSNPSALSSDDDHVWDRVSRGGGQKK